MNIIYIQYFKTAKRKSNQDPKFLDRINGAFICLVATAIRYSLKGWRTGAHDEKGPEFKYQIAYCKLYNVLRGERQIENQAPFNVLKQTGTFWVPRTRF